MYRQPSSFLSSRPAGQAVDSEIAELLVRRWSGQASDADEHRIARWIAEDANRVNVVSLLQRTWIAAEGRQGELGLINVRDRVLQAVLTETEGGVSGSRHNFPPKFARKSTRVARFIAIALAVAVIAGVTVQHTPLNGLLHQVLQASSSTSVEREYITRRGEHATIELPDGTRVTLGPDSRLQYSDVTRSAIRSMRLQGIGFFSVTHDPAHPFAVYANNAVVQELGTSFSVAAFPEDTTVQVIVADGRVALRDHISARAGGTVLVRADAAVLNASGFVTVRRGVDVAEELGWTQRHLIFRTAPVRDVIQILERWYDLDISVRNPALLSQQVTVEFSQQSVDEMLAQFARVLEVKYERSNRKVRLG